MTNKKYISTGNYLLDNILSNGIPNGNINVIYGKSNGKSNFRKRSIRTSRIIKIIKILNKSEENG